ncbi:hypothetical protein AGMMS50229_12360 [Campylobacterota bacterium]|nr:hypothetical protein AGMMS50229_12360 [Campylobacterota bacterium]
MLKQLSNLIYCDMRDLECEMPPSCRFFGNAFADFPFLLIDDFLSRDECAAIVESALANGETAEAKVVDGANASKVDTAHRSTVWHTINGQLNIF